ncbi:MAG TPA: hypothetical protein VJ783_03730 [Pirellulales bacterium]|nr:hypothetical protein [Pirellulales bacterium]
MTTITKQEESLGFSHFWIENEQNRFGDDPLGNEPQLLQVVARPIDESVWLFKLRSPTGIVYSEMQYAQVNEREPPYWRNVRLSNWDDPITAVEAAQRLPRDAEYARRVPPLVEGTVGNRRILFDESLISPREIEQYGGERVERHGRRWVSFPVHE